ncbi:hypothetical protein ACM25O_14285 [Sulfitobacter pontiacus]
MRMRICTSRGGAKQAATCPLSGQSGSAPRLPQSDAVVFTIHTYVVRDADAPA